MLPFNQADSEFSYSVPPLPCRIPILPEDQSLNHFIGSALLRESASLPQTATQPLLHVELQNSRDTAAHLGIGRLEELS